MYRGDVRAIVSDQIKICVCGKRSVPAIYSRESSKEGFITARVIILPEASGKIEFVLSEYGLSLYPWVYIGNVVHRVASAFIIEVEFSAFFVQLELFSAGCTLPISEINQSSTCKNEAQSSK